MAEIFNDGTMANLGPVDFGGVRFINLDANEE